MSGALQADLQRTLEDEVARRTLPGATGDLWVDGEPAWSGAAGVSDPESGSPLAAGARFPIYSITKTFTAVCLLRLAERGRLQLDETVERWLPQLPYAGEVSVRQLLGHRAGVFNYSALADYHEAVIAAPEHPWSFDDFVERAALRPLDFDPGAGWSYSNTGYTLLKHIIEQLTEGSFGDAIQQEVARPLDLHATAALEELSDLQEVVPGYSRLLSDPPGEGPLRDVRDRYHPGWCGTGVLASTGAELCAFFDALLGARVTSESSLAQMLVLHPVPGQHPPAVEPSYGLGLMGDPAGPRGPDYGHGGGGPGWNLRAETAPELHGHRVSLAVLCNHDEEDAWPIGDALLDVAARALA